LIRHWYCVPLTPDAAGAATSRSAVASARLSFSRPGILRRQCNRLRRNARRDQCRAVLRPRLMSARLRVECRVVSSEAVDKYVQSLEEPKRGTLQALRRTILEIVPDADEVISYRVPAFRVDGRIVAGFAAFKDHLSYLPFSGSVLDRLTDELEGYTMTKSSLHFPVDRPLPRALVQKLIEVRMAEAGRRKR
jgi:uncharacterized protein YdhG (YjbR/CyaY superfamily)